MHYSVRLNNEGVVITLKCFQCKKTQVKDKSDVIRNANSIGVIYNSDKHDRWTIATLNIEPPLGTFWNENRGEKLFCSHLCLKRWLSQLPL